MNKIEKEKREAENSRTAWLLTLEIARERGDFATAAQAQRELERLGVVVTYRKPKTGGTDHV